MIFMTFVKSPEQFKNSLHELSETVRISQVLIQKHTTFHRMNQFWINFEAQHVWDVSSK